MPASLRRSFFQRLFGKCATPLPHDPDCWTIEDRAILIDLARASELRVPGGALRLEGKGLSERILVVYGEDGEYHALRNHCSHGKRRLDPVPGAGEVQCCSLGKSTFDYAGVRVHGAAREDIAIYPVTLEGERLTVAR